MKKIILTMLLVGLSSTVFAKNGGSDPIKLEFKNSQAGFVAESLEHSMRLLVNVDGGDKDAVKDAAVVSNTIDQSIVTITNYDNSSVVYSCARIDHYSNGGTVLKKEVLCQKQ